MKYKKLGKTNLSTSVLGLGTLRLPMGQNQDYPDYKNAIELVRYAIERGINYIDTAKTYLGGAGEKIVGDAITGFNREDIILTSKCPIWEINTDDDFDRILELQLTTIGVDYIDCYFFHALGKERWRKIQDLQLIKKIESARNKGYINHIGFSFHDDLQTFKEILLGYDGWELCQVQYNYVDIDRQAGTTGIQMAKERGLGVIVMEPLQGGRLASPPIQVKKALQPKTPVESAFDFLYDREEIDVVLSGVHSVEELNENIYYASNGFPNKLNDEERSKYVCAKQLFETTANVLCTGCKYCLPCTNGLNIPELMRIYNKFGTISYRDAKIDYDQQIVRADSCLHCEKCNQKCPQKIDISITMSEIKKVFEPPLPELNLQDLKYKWPEKYKAIIQVSDKD